MPMFMMLGYSPELTQVVYRIGDSATNIISPMMSFFALIIVYFQKYDEKAGIGTIVSTMLPYSMIFMDVRMPPGMDGIQTILQIWEKHPNIEVVICTAFSDYSWDNIVKTLGSTDRLLFMKKPFDSVAVKQTALSLTKKWDLDRKNRESISNLRLM